MANDSSGAKKGGSNRGRTGNESTRLPKSGMSNVGPKKASLNSNAKKRTTYKSKK